MADNEGKRGPSLVTVAVIAVLVGALAAGTAVWLLQRSQMDDKEAALLSALQDKVTLAGQVDELEQQVSAAKDEIGELRRRLKVKDRRVPPEPSAEAGNGSDLADGRYLTSIEAVDAESDPASVTVDVLQWFTGNAANKAAKEDGAETPVPNDYYVRNESKRLRTLDVAGGTDAQVLYWHRDLIQDGKDVPLEVFASVMGGSADWQRLNQDGMYWITLEDGEVTRIEVQFVP